MSGGTSHRHSSLGLNLRHLRIKNVPPSYLASTPLSQRWLSGVEATGTLITAIIDRKNHKEIFESVA
ncbi:hypothetical protein [Pseudanabaena sp. 'Roaring Creek']|uniref:hypothetical protein n=1 Tax=Pseudanabaena sp. 'Roaring Creek' TaxID=1681830 RepID=UPI000B22A82F|nr:hypothetical protein [Pseudanabaena sp. 'Roaring Creek']